MKNIVLCGMTPSWLVIYTYVSEKLAAFVFREIDYCDDGYSNLLQKSVTNYQ